MTTEDFDPDGDPIYQDEDDPVFQEEMFDMFKSMGWTPDDITTDPVYQQKYAEWLKKNGG